MITRNPREISFFARTDFRGQHKVFGIRQRDRLHHMYLIGKTGVGKSTLLATLIKQDIERGRGLMLLDPHGELVSQVRQLVPPSRRPDVIYFNVPDNRERLGFNPLETVPENRRSLAAGGLLDAFKKLWADSWGPRLEHILRNAIHALLEHPGATLADIPRILDDSSFRKTVAANVTNAEVRRFWLKEFEGYPARLKAEAIAPIQNKVGAFLTDPVLRDVLTVPRGSIRLREIMDEGKVLLVDLSKGKIGEDTSSLLGSLLASRINLAALSRADTPERERRDFFVYLDEFQTFTSLSFVTMLSELRKYHVGAVLAHQYLAQLDEQVKEGILGNVGTLVVFRLGATDAEVFAQEFDPHFTETDITNLANFRAYLKLMIDGQVSAPFSAETIPPESLNET
ncbi:MAG: type IV secretion system DNA-binding domain-containing protein [Candidatus Hydrogenedentota bacterium]